MVPLLHVLMNTIIREYFANSYCLIILTDNNESLSYHGDVPIVNIHPINATVNEFIAFHEYGCQDIIIDHNESLKVFESFEFKLKFHRARFNFRRYLIAAEDMAIFDSPVLEYVVNLLVIVPDNTTDESENYNLLTHQYVGREGNNNPQILDYWFGNNRSFLNGAHLYPEKLRNQQGRALRCATFNYKPYSIIEAIGSENAIAHLYADIMNMTVEYILDDKEWGIIYDNWTGDGILGNVAIDKADMGYGALYTWAHEYGFLDLSKPVVRTGITCLVPAPKIIFHQTMIRLPQILLMQSLSFTGRPIDTAFRYLFPIFLYSLVITATYSSGLATVMTLPRYIGKIDTVWDLATSDLRWGATQDAWIYSILEEERPQYTILLDKFVATSQENLLALAKTNRFAFSIERLPSGQYAIGSYITEDIVKSLRLMHEDLYWEYCIFMVRKSSPLLESLDNLILKLNEAGLIKFWEKTAVRIHMDSKVQEIVAYYRASQVKESDSTVVKLTWVHVEGAFGILLSGFLLSIICFVVEVVYKKKTTYNMHKEYLK
ncbi:hypothetical protein RI129_003733 [Pyrocoelia pectoralis]|uniref:Uncharacterized protein n=1 Tax=Pyrocoelia pectoralis TaxID=417401 RepID=A0AAN7VQY0_9COLE